jgi:hypothetical protein
MHRRIDIDHIVRLYRAYAHDLDRVREEQRKLLAPPTSLKAQLDDLEAEITCLLLPGTRPETVVEIGTFHGWSTTWILQALREDNGTGHPRHHGFGAAAGRHRDAPGGTHGVRRGGCSVRASSSERGDR